MSSAIISRDGMLERLELNRRAGASDADRCGERDGCYASDAQVRVLAQPRLFKSGLIVAFTPLEAVSGPGKQQVQH